MRKFSSEQPPAPRPRNYARGEATTSEPIVALLIAGPHARLVDSNRHPPAKGGAGLDMSLATFGWMNSLTQVKARADAFWLCIQNWPSNRLRGRSHPPRDKS